MWSFGWWILINYLYEVLKLKQDLRKNKKDTGKTPFFVIDPFRTPFFVLTLASDRAVSYVIVAFSVLVVSTKKRHSRLLKRNCVFQKICFKGEVLKGLQNFQLMSLKKMPISKTEGYSKNP